MKYLFSTISAFLVLSTMLMFTGCKNYDDDISTINSRLVSLETSTAQISVLSDKVASLETSVASLSAGISALTSEVDANSQDISDLKAAVAVLESAIDDAKDDIEELQAAVAKQLTAEEVQKMIDKANAELSKKVNEALDKVAGMQIVIDALPETIKAQVKEAVASIKAAVGALAGQIQSIVYLPVNNKNFTDKLYTSVLKYTVYKGMTLTTKRVLSATYEITPASLSGTITKDQVKINFLIRKGDKTYKETREPDAINANDGKLNWNCILNDKDFEEYGQYDYICVNTSVIQNNMIEGVDYGTQISSPYVETIVTDPKETDIYFTLYDGENVYDGNEFENEVEWSSYKHSRKSVFGSYEPYFIAVTEKIPVGVFSPEEVASLFGQDVDDITPYVTDQKTIKYDEKQFVVSEAGLKSTVAVNTDYIDSDTKAKALVGEYVITDIIFSVTTKGTSHDAAVYYVDGDDVDTDGNTVTAAYGIIGKSSSAAVIESANVVWNYYDNWEVIDDDTPTVRVYKKYEYPELGISKDILPAGKSVDADIYGADGKVIEGAVGTVSRVSSKLVKVTLELKDSDFPETDSEYTLSGEYYDDEKEVAYPFTMSLNVNARPADDEVELSYSISGSSTATEISFAPVVPAFKGNESYYLGNTGYTKDALYQSYASDIPTKEADQSFIEFHPLSPNASWSLVVDGKEIDKDKIGAFVSSVTLMYQYDDNSKSFKDFSTINFTNPVGYGHTYTLVFPKTSYWGQTINYTVKVTVSKADGVLETTGYVKDGVVTVGGSIVDNKYEITNVTILKYLKMNAGTVDPEDFSVKFSYATEAGELFDYDPAATEESKASNHKIGCTGSLSNLPIEATFNTDGSIKEDKVSDWYTYEGLFFTVSAQLYNGDVKTGSPLTFKVATGDPIKKMDCDAAINETGRMNEAKEVYLYQNMKVYGILEPSVNLVYYNPSVEGTAGYPWATTTTEIVEGKSVEKLKTINGNQIYYQNLTFGTDTGRGLSQKAYVEGKEVPFTDVASIDNETGKLILKAQSAAAVYKFEIPVVMEYIYNHNGVQAKTGTIIVNITVK